MIMFGRSDRLLSIAREAGYASIRGKDYTLARVA